MKNCIMLWKNDAVDLAINNQRRAFSDAYNNEVLAESKIYIELSSKNPLSKLSSLETEDLKNNVYENVILPAELDGRKVDAEYVDGILVLLGLSEKREALPGTLSGGQQQRAAIARALAAKPAIILADEPTGNLDSVTSHDVLGLLKMAAKQFSQTLILIIIKIKDLKLSG